MTNQDQIAPAPTAPGRRAPVGAIVLWVIAGLLYSYVLWGAIDNLVELPQAFGANGLTPPWALLILDVALPFVAYTAAILLGRRRRLLERVILFFLGLVLQSCATVGSIAYIQHG